MKPNGKLHMAGVLLRRIEACDCVVCLKWEYIAVNHIVPALFVLWIAREIFRLQNCVNYRMGFHTASSRVLCFCFRVMCPLHCHSVLSRRLGSLSWASFSESEA